MAGLYAGLEVPLGEAGGWKRVAIPFKPDIYNAFIASLYHGVTTDAEDGTELEVHPVALLPFLITLIAVQFLVAMILVQEIDVRQRPLKSSDFSYIIDSNLVYVKVVMIVVVLFTLFTKLYSSVDLALRLWDAFGWGPKLRGFCCHRAGLVRGGLITPVVACMQLGMAVCAGYCAICVILPCTSSRVAVFDGMAVFFLVDLDGPVWMMAKNLLHLEDLKLREVEICRHPSSWCALCLRRLISTMAAPLLLFCACLAVGHVLCDVFDYNLTPEAFARCRVWHCLQRQRVSDESYDECRTHLSHSIFGIWDDYYHVNYPLRLREQCDPRASPPGVCTEEVISHIFVGQHKRDPLALELIGASLATLILVALPLLCSKILLWGSPATDEDEEDSDMGQVASAAPRISERQVPNSIEVLRVQVAAMQEELRQLRVQAAAFPAHLRRKPRAREIMAL